jgi:16S rRNA processing protein RimM
MARPVDRLEVGRVTKPHGLKGDVLVWAISNRPERFDTGAVLEVAGVERRIVSARPHGDRWLVHFDGVDDRDGAEAIRGALLTGAPLADEDDDEVWAHEVVGATLVDRAGAVLGTVTAVEANPAHDLLVLDSGALVPVVFVVEHGAGRVVVDLPDGLLDL